MKDDKKGLPVKSDANDNDRFKHQEEYDNLGKAEKQKESDVRKTQHAEQLRDKPRDNE